MDNSERRQRRALRQLASAMYDLWLVARDKEAETWEMEAAEAEAAAAARWARLEGCSASAIADLEQQVYRILEVA